MARQAPTKMLGRILKNLRLVTESQIQEAIALQKETGGALGEILVERNYITREDLTLALATQSGMEVVSLDDMEIPPEVISRISPAIAQVYRVVPVRFTAGTLVVALAEPTHIKTLDDLRFLLNTDIKGAVATESSVDRAIQRYYSAQEDINSILEELSIGAEEIEELTADVSQSQSIDLESMEEMANIAPVRRLLNLILLQAIQDRASDIHFEPFEDEFKIRYRVDGVLYEMVPPPKHLHIAVSSRIKVMAQLDIAERRMPQDGRIELNISGNSVDLRISTLPTMFGESVVMRVLDRRMVSLDINEIGMRRDDLDVAMDLAYRPNGIILCTGPTGSGKTTTLYATLRERNDIGVKIITTEDPVEYDIEGIMQMQIREDIGFTFAKAMRAILRQDPDIILVGEIRDKQTGEMAIQASLTGHLVFTTVHTNDAPTAITRLIDLGLEPYLINATLEGIIAQRLVRKICTNCKEEYEPTQEAILLLGLRPDEVEGKRFYRGRGCERCNNIGYFGRLGIFEILVINNPIREMMLQNASIQDIRRTSRQYGCRSLRDSGLLAIYDGLTTIEEVTHCTFAD